MELLLLNWMYSSLIYVESLESGRIFLFPWYCSGYNVSDLWCQSKACVQHLWCQRNSGSKISDSDEFYVSEAGTQRSPRATRTPRAAWKGWHWRELTRLQRFLYAPSNFRLFLDLTNSICKRKKLAPHVNGFFLSVRYWPVNFPYIFKSVKFQSKVTKIRICL